MGEGSAGGGGNKASLSEEVPNEYGIVRTRFKIVGSEDHPLRYRYVLGFEWSPRHTLRMVMKKIKFY